MEERAEVRAVALLAAVLAKRQDRYVEGDSATVERAKRFERYLTTGQ